MSGNIPDLSHSVRLSSEMSTEQHNFQDHTALCNNLSAGLAKPLIQFSFPIINLKFFFQNCKVHCCISEKVTYHRYSSLYPQILRELLGP